MKLKYIGSVPTLVKVAKDLPKMEVKKGKVFECDEKIGLQLLRYLGLYVKVTTKADKKAEKEQRGRIVDDAEKAKEQKEKFIEKVAEAKSRLIEDHGMREEEFRRIDDNGILSLDKAKRAEVDTIKAKLIGKHKIEEQTLEDISFSELKEMLETFENDVHVVTQEDLDANPDLVEKDVAVGDEIEIPEEKTERFGFITKFFRKK